MKRFRWSIISAAAMLVLFSLGIGLAGSQAQNQAAPVQQVTGEKKALTMEEYGRWRSIASVAVTDDGQWACYIFRPREGDSTLYVRHLDTDKLYTIPIGSQGGGARGGGAAPAGGAPAAGGGGAPQFSDDSHWIAYIVNPPD